MTEQLKEYNSQEALAEAHALATATKELAVGSAGHDQESIAQSRDAMIVSPADRSKLRDLPLNADQQGVIKAGIRANNARYETGNIYTAKTPHGEVGGTYDDIKITRPGGYTETISGNTERAQRAAEIIAIRAARELGKGAIEAARAKAASADQLESKLAA